MKTVTAIRAPLFITVVSANAAIAQGVSAEEIADAAICSTAANGKARVVCESPPVVTDGSVWGSAPT
jgi:hypothetical protein